MYIGNNVLKFSVKAQRTMESSNRALIMKIIKNENIVKGNCLDIGSNGGQLGVVVAEETDMNVYLFDSSELSLYSANRRIDCSMSKNKISVLPWDAKQITIDNDSIDLIIGMHSTWFMSNRKRAMNEIYRVLAPEGVAYIQVGTDYKEKYGNSPLKFRRDITKNKIVEQLVTDIHETKIRDFDIVAQSSGVWFIVRKGEEFSL